MNDTFLIDQLLTDQAAQTSSRAQSVLAQTIERDQLALAEAFYTVMMQDPEAATFLETSTVQSKLKSGMQRWLTSLFCHTTSDELKAVLAMQRHIGEVHARAEIPVHLVARGMRVLKRKIIERLITTDLDRDELINAVLRTDRLIDIAFEEMSEAFVQSHETGVRVDEAYRMVAAGQNLSLEREKQLGALLDWENRLFRSVATDFSMDDLPNLKSSTFGLWLHHKAPLIFDATHEMAMIDHSMQRIDDTLIPQFTLLSHADTHFDAVRTLVKAITTEVEQLKFLLSSMFERMTDLEVGRDVLTQLFNRRFLQTIMKREIELYRRQKTPFCVLMVDIDFFKRVNDTHGHDGGDRVLQGIAGLLLNQVRASDFVFRYGGEEFLVVLAELTLPQAEAVAEKIRSRIESNQVLLSDNRSVKVTLSIGVAEFDGHPDYQRLVDRADKALYAAKHGGRNRWVSAD